MENDFRLAQKATAGDTDAMGKLIAQYRVALFRIAYGKLGRYEDAQDAVAESVIRACRSIHRLKSPAHFAPWIRAIVRNEARRILLRRLHQEDQELSIACEDSGETARDDLRGNVLQAISDLPRDQAYALHAHYLEGVSVKEISVFLARPEGTVKWMLSQGRARLAESLKEYKPMTAHMTVKKTNHAVLITPNFELPYQKQLLDSLGKAGWNSINAVTDPAEFLRFVASKHEAGTPAEVIRAGDFVVLSERIGNISAWELMPFLLKVRKKTEFTILLVVEEGRTPEEMDATAMSAYVSGIDFLLTRPLALDEFTAFARRARKVLSKESSALQT